MEASSNLEVGCESMTPGASRPKHACASSMMADRILQLAGGVVIQEIDSNISSGKRA
jgi:hypothetical protein